MNYYRKVPIGIQPRWVYEEARKHEITSAISRYIEADVPIPIEWVEEYNSIIDYLVKELEE